MAPIIHLQPSSPKKVRTALIITIVITAVEIQLFTLLYFFAPKKPDITTLIPMPVPTAMAIKITVIGWDAPTAPSALTPMNRPATILSTTLYTC